MNYCRDIDNENGANDISKIRHGRPPGLRGKDIGMYYKNLGRKRKENDNTDSIRLHGSINVPFDIINRIEACLKEFNKLPEKGNVTSHFEKNFQRLLSSNFEEILEESKKLTNDLHHLNHHDISKDLKIDWMNKQKSVEYIQRWEQRKELPTIKQSQRILTSLHANQIVLIVGNTGCGKSTQIPQLLLDDYVNKNQGSGCHIVCLQPRRISAITVAERVAYERHESLGNTVGYQIRLESRLPHNQCSILYCTTGIILQKMQTDLLLLNVKIIILDEIHERSIETDLLMGLLKLILPYRSDLKIILMSATVNEEVFREYFNNCCTIYIEGTMYPIEVLYLEDILQETGYNRFNNSDNSISGRQKDRQKNHSNHNKGNNDICLRYQQMINSYLPSLRGKYDRHVLESLQSPDTEGCNNLQFIEYLIFYICKYKPPGAILVFLPGYDKISKLNNQLKNPTLPSHRHLIEDIEIYPLHSLMPTIHQIGVFQPAPNGKRKIILSTIIAETSVTIDDVIYVINTGRTKISEYNLETNVQTLEENWISKSNSQQRKGRAGRVQPGVCYNLFTRIREEQMSEAPTPEILRSKLESIILDLKLIHIRDPFVFLSTLISVPQDIAIRNGINILKRIEALDINGNITPLGVHLGRLPIDPQIGKMVLMAALFNCLDPITSAAAGLSFKSPFYTPLKFESKVDNIKREFAHNTRSDHLLIHNAIKEYRMASNKDNFCYTNFLSTSIIERLESMKQQFTHLLKTSSFIESTDCMSKLLNLNSSNIPLVRAIIAAGLYPNIAHLRHVRQIRNRVHAVHRMSTPEDKRINFHPSSVNSGQTSFDSHYFVYFQKQKTSDLYMLDTTMVFPMALLIFGDGVVEGITPEKIYYISVANQYNFKCDSATSNIILRLRVNLKLLLEKKAMYPSPIQINSSDHQLIKAIEILLSLDDKDVDIVNQTNDDETDV